MTQATKQHPPLYICPLTEQALFKIEGEQSNQFLQGQLSCDLREVSNTQCSLGAHCNPKGSMLALFRVHQVEQAYFLSVNKLNLEAAIANLNKYIMFSKADIVNLQEQWEGFGIMGEQAAQLVEQHFGQAPAEDYQQIAQSDQFVVKVPGERYEVWQQVSTQKPFQQQAAVAEHLQDNQYWKKQQIINAIADITPMSSATYIPQMCNLQHFNAISFKKGCYTGQEVITRLHFRGKLNKILITAKCERSALSHIEVGTEINSQSREKVAKVLQYAVDSKYIYIQLVINYKYAKEPLMIAVDDTDKIELQTLELPYTLNPELFERKD